MDHEDTVRHNGLEQILAVELRARLRKLNLRSLQVIHF